MKYNDVFEATDALGRVLPTIAETGEKRTGKYVGMFYFLWCGEHSKDFRPLDITKLLDADPKAGYKPDSEVWGKYSTMHHWGEPLFGYYYTADEWVMRRHIKMLTAADIDFLVFDATNAVFYKDASAMMMRLLHEYREAGFNTPKVVFYTNTASGKTTEAIYQEFYKTNFCADTWFYLDGKPLIIAVADECSDEAKDFFTIRASQWPNEPTKLNGWPWMDFERPQRVLKNYREEPEIINVSVAQHPQIRFGDSAMYGETGNRGRSFHNNQEDKSEGAYKYGYNFAEQWERALDTDPPYVFVTGWNEWIAGRWGGTETRPLLFVDCCDLEYSRDIEPMKGGYSDNYYLQLIDYVRRYKGTDPSVTATKGETVAYRNFPKGAFIRDCDGYNTHYTDYSGRNEILESSVTDNGEELVFTAKTASDIIKYDFQGSWMSIFIGVENSDLPSFGCYNYIANAHQFSDKITSLAKCTENSRTIEADTFKLCACLDYSWSGNEITIKIPKSELGLGEKYKLYFKWVDTRAAIVRVEDFYINGDAAPIGRLNYVFEIK